MTGAAAVACPGGSAQCATATPHAVAEVPTPVAKKPRRRGGRNKTRATASDPSEVPSTDACIGVQNSRPCCHNSWDNVRVVRQRMTLRCRICQLQWRAPVEEMWQQMRCEPFLHGTCSEGTACTKVHMHHRKQNLCERMQRHGTRLAKTSARVGSQKSSSSTSCGATSCSESSCDLQWADSSSQGTLETFENIETLETTRTFLCMEKEGGDSEVGSSIGSSEPLSSGDLAALLEKVRGQLQEGF
eukprot:TRINITY_DN30506_c0_g1_i2.p2 TRINITY_DN30506_c0_g1~~TRINITY_DN30506_c0_g1_i2.p2  ORF type:complete len:244 (+),score=55.92 TRINITY_DN30506_c0_g1_i2:177-908(+)